jgi:streptolysin S family bacteriocin protoxin
MPPNQTSHSLMKNQPFTSSRVLHHPMYPHLDKALSRRGRPGCRCPCGGDWRRSDEAFRQLPVEGRDGGPPPLLVIAVVVLTVLLSSFRSITAGTVGCCCCCCCCHVLITVGGAIASRLEWPDPATSPCGGLEEEEVVPLCRGPCRHRSNFCRPH